MKNKTLHNIGLILCISTITCLFSCKQVIKETSSDTLFTYVSSDITNIHFSNHIKESESENIFIYDNLYAGAGVGLGDINNDGLLDVYFCGNQVKDKLYLNKGDFEFEDITESSRINEQDEGWSSSISMVDINQDGFLDLFVTKELYDDQPELRRDKLYINQGNNTFMDMAEVFGLGDTLRSRGAAFFDYDLDDDLDVFILHQPPNPGIYSKYRPMSDDGSLLGTQYAPRLYENEGGKYVDVSKEANVLSGGFGNAIAIADINEDGYPDVVIANDFEAPDKLYINNGDGTFMNKANEAFLHTCFYSMGIDIADINNDSKLDIYVVDMVAQDNFRIKSNMSGMEPEKFWKIVDKDWNYQYMYNVLQLNNGNGTFSDVAKLGGISSTDWSWSPLVADFDNDGLKDIFVSNGLLRDIRNTDADYNIKKFIHEKIQNYLKEHENVDDVNIWDIVDYRELTNFYPSNPIQNKFYRNSGSFGFEDVSSLWGDDIKGFSNGSAYGDLDNDGDLDLVVNNINQEAFIMKNNSSNNFLRINLTSPKNQSLLGTKVVISYDNGKQQLVELNNVRGMYSSSENAIHFGLGKIKIIDEIKVQWPHGKSTYQSNVRANQVVEMSYANAASNTKIQSTQQAIFLESELKDVHFRHKENDFNDFDRQVLLPHKLSQFGPALAVADINNDGLDDFYVGGAFGQSPALYIQGQNESFQKINTSFWTKEAPYEDVDALFVDINNDDLIDLYVVSGGNAYSQNDFHYTDRLYINQGDGNFAKGAIINAARTSGSVVKGHDFDGDGDIDLFVGGRHSPHQYPMPTSSMILINDNGQLKNETKNIAPDLIDIGMVTDAIWTDYDNDDNKDLIIVGEWMPITVFKTNQGKLEKQNIEYLSSTTGWWFSIEQGDFDHDGDMDYVLGNLGLNYKYKTSVEKPFDIYYNDFDQNGSEDIVLGYYDNDKHCPLRGFSCSSEQIPQLKADIKKYDIFASMDIAEVYGQDQLDDALYYQVKNFASSYLENLGNNNFTISKLPNSAQTSNINDMLIDDFDHDGNMDILAIQNFYVAEVETPRNDAGTGVLLLGNGKGGFEAMPSSQSNFFVNTDAKKMHFLEVENRSGVLIANNNNELKYFRLQSSWQ